ncbi:hypothetical protein SAMN06265784_101657 [Paraburkholderia susongensis]|uniref:Uncharacterized protein n=1 Tax=Paraburkholderia susongensis TaxID=1515439 RepID=A0A1X7IGD6_9BURK|nr:hypothetical protein SAMN06265784_101657 [Paraburkholderia susongensis]
MRRNATGSTCMAPVECALELREAKRLWGSGNAPIYGLFLRTPPVTTYCW